MSHIHLLDIETQSKIAAGEVIDNPASILKELIENSLDAACDKITIELNNGGKTFLKIHDNGVGISPDDLRLAVKRFATSKLNTISDLDKINSFGFRGEALASISAVASLQITSQNGPYPTTKLVVSGDIEKEFGEVSTIIGTEIEVSNLFFNIPARQKFLRSDLSELRSCIKIVEEIAIKNPFVSFQLLNDGKSIINLPKVENWLSRISQIYPSNFSDNLLPISLSTPDLNLSGFILKPDKLISRKICQLTFINQRLIQNPVLQKAMYDGYKGLIVKGLYPSFILSLDLNPELIDVNVHPKKREIKLLYPSEIYKSIVTAVSNSIFPHQTHSINDDPFLTSKKSFYSPESDFKFNQAASQHFQNYLQNLNLENTTQDNLSENFTKNPKIIGQVKNSYIICETENEFWVVDQHALHERILYERLKLAIEEKNIEQQKLTMPETIYLDPVEMITFKENIDIFVKLGFELEAFDQKSIILEAIPNILFLIKKSPVKIIKEIIFDLKELSEINNEKDHKEILDAKLKSMACRSAVMFGDKLDINEMSKLLSDLNELKIPYCPHGRPAIVKLTWDELNKMFKRIV